MKENRPFIPDEDIFARVTSGKIARLIIEGYDREMTDPGVPPGVPSQEFSLEELARVLGYSKGLKCCLSWSYREMVEIARLELRQSLGELLATGVLAQTFYQDRHKNYHRKYRINGEKGIASARGIISRL